MARPRSFIRVVHKNGQLTLVDKDKKSGTEIHGLSRNATTGVYYSIRDDGSRQYWGTDLADAIQAFRKTLTDAPPVTFKTAADQVEAPIDDLPDDVVAVLKKTLAGFTVDNKWAADNVDVSALARLVVNVERKRQGLPALPPIPIPGQEVKVEIPKGNRLRDVLKVMVELKEDDIHPSTLSRYRTSFDRFITAVGNKRVSELTADDFAVWRRWAKRNMGTAAGSHYNATHSTIKTIINTVRKDKPSWGWAPGLMDWLTQWERKAHLVAKSNKAMMPPAVFDSLLKWAQEWKDTDPLSVEVVNKGNQQARQRSRALRRVGYQIQYRGRMMIPAVYLSANCGLGIVELRTITWEHLKLDAPIPFMDFPREKQAKQVGAPVERKIPLLPSTVKALIELRSLDNPSVYVFPAGENEYADAYSAYSTSGFQKIVADLLEVAGVTEYTWKHLRNIGGSLAKRAKLSNDERTAFLGHVEKGTNRFYEEDVDHTYLIALVDLIGQSHFHGETVNTPAPK